MCNKFVVVSYNMIADSTKIIHNKIIQCACCGCVWLCVCVCGCRCVELAEYTVNVLQANLLRCKNSTSEWERNLNEFSLANVAKLRFWASSFLFVIVLVVVVVVIGLCFNTHNYVSFVISIFSSVCILFAQADLNLFCMLNLNVNSYADDYIFYILFLNMLNMV